MPYPLGMKHLSSYFGVPFAERTSFPTQPDTYADLQHYSRNIVQTDDYYTSQSLLEFVKNYVPVPPNNAHSPKFRNTTFVNPQLRCMLHSTLKVGFPCFVIAFNIWVASALAFRLRFKTTSFINLT